MLLNIFDLFKMSDKLI